MLRIQTRRARPGMTLAMPVTDPDRPHTPRLKVGHTLTADDLPALLDQHVETLWVGYPDVQRLEPWCDRSRAATQGRVLSQIADAFNAIQHEASAKLPYDTYTRGLGELVQQMLDDPEAADLLADQAADMANPGGVYDDRGALARRAASVAYLSILMGLKLEGYLMQQRPHVHGIRARRLTSLALGAMLHDVGVTQLSSAARRWYEQGGDPADELCREHPALGYRLVRDHIDPAAANIVLNHHQRWDGRGFAGAGFPVLEGRRIHVFARIVAAAQHYERLRRPEHLPAQPGVWALRAMLSEPMRNWFDPRVLRALVEVAPPYPPGAILRLSDGRWAIAVDHHADQPCRPTVQPIPDPTEVADPRRVAGRPIDLRTQPRRLHVAVCEGWDVSAYNFEPELLEGETRAAG